MATQQLARGLWTGFAPTQDPFQVPNGMAENLRTLDDVMGLYTLRVPQTLGTALPSNPGDGDGQIFTDGSFAVFNAGSWKQYDARPGVKALMADGSDIYLSVAEGGWLSMRQHAALDTGLISQGIYLTTAQGIAAVPDGRFFSTPSPNSNESLILWQRSGNTAVEVKRYPTFEALDAARQEAKAWASKEGGPVEGNSYSAKHYAGLTAIDAASTAGDAAQTAVDRQIATEAAADAIAAASASGDFVFARSHADALTKLPLPPGKVVEIAKDEALSDSPRTRYIVDATGTAIEFVVNLTLIAARYVRYNSGAPGAIDTTVAEKLKEIISVKDFGALGNGTGDDAVAVNKALLYAHSIGGAVVAVPAGVYNIATRMHIGRNTELRSSKGVIFKRTGPGGFLSNDLGIDNSVTNYLGNGNVVIDGGVWDGNSVANYGSFNHIEMGQADGITIKNCTFLDGVRAHCVDLSACRNVWITNNKFVGYSKYKHSPDGYGTSTDTLGEVTTPVTFTAGNRISGTSPGNGECVKFASVTGNPGVVANQWYFVIETSGATFQLSLTFGGAPIAFGSGGSGSMQSWVRNYVEAIQLDHNVPGSFSYGALNGTPNVNVFFTGNVVSANPARADNTFGSYGTGIGSHGSVHDRYMENIVVEGNSFLDCIFAGVRAWKWKGLVVSGNTFKNCERCVHVTATNWQSQSANNPDGSPSGRGQAGSDFAISDNIFNAYKDIGIFFAQPTSFAPGEQKFYHERVAINNNTFNGTSSQVSGMDLRWVKDAVVSNNSFADVQRAIALRYVSGMIVNGNVLRNALREFIFQSDDQPAVGLGNSESLSIVGNHCSNTGYSGINVAAVNNFSICNNVVIGASTFEPTRFGISASSGARNGLISGNSILDGGAENKPAYGIYVTPTCTGVTLGPNKVQVGVTGEAYYGSVNPGRVIQGMTTIESTGQGDFSMPGLLLKGFSSSEGEFAVPAGEALSMGNFDEVNKVFTPVVQFTRNANWQIYGAGKGVILKTPDGSKDYLVSIDNLGSIKTTMI